MTVLVYGELVSPTQMAGTTISTAPVVSGGLRTPVGLIATLLRVPVVVSAGVRSPVGILRAVVYSKATYWAQAGFPLPRMEGYEYHRDAGLVQAPYLSGGTRQRRRWINGRRIATLALELDTSLLHAFEEALDVYGYDWFNMPMVTGDNTDPLAQIHLVRIIDKPSFGEIYGATITVSFTVEMRDYGDSAYRG